MALWRHPGGMFLALGALGLMITSSPLEIRSGYPILRDVFVNSKGPYRMLLDTGAQSSSLRPGLAAEAGLRPGFAVEVRTALGATVAPVAEAGRVEIGGLELEGVEVLLQDPPAVAHLGWLDGVIGQSVLGRTGYWIDYGAKSVRWDPEGGLEGCLEGERLAFTVVDGRPAVEARAAGGVAMRLVLDSGASHLILFGWGGGGRSGMAEMRTSHSLGQARMVRVQSLEMGGMRWRGLTVGVVETGDAGVGGLLPARLLKSFYVSNRRRVVLVELRVSARCASGPAEPLSRRAEATGRGY